jgi:hypothetical protein
MTVFMDKIVDHLFILEVKVLWRTFQETTLRAYEDSADVAQKRKTKQRRKIGNKTTQL